MKSIKTLIIVIFTIIFLISCSSIPKPSDNFDGIVVVDVIQTGVFNEKLGDSVIKVIDEESLLEIQSTVIRSNGRVIIKLPSGVYRLKAAYSPNRKDDHAVSILNESIVVEKGKVQYVNQYVEFHFEKIGTGGFSPKTFWKQISKEKMEQNIKDIEGNNNITFWNLVY
ncbi:hypothetical protein [Spirochaeta isovalerica]|uniref:Lipoprotein n=1 Tax=Spirochaeta isovalerica TaxID=150 RepID=A0A841RK94_9SPIO|nr:hypothetical protein [Spirochaeta isovalerica]MBB6482692.1 hypothetical protein [Spirochaeta isovalerica]